MPLNPQIRNHLAVVVPAVACISCDQSETLLPSSEPGEAVGAPLF